MFLLCFLSGFHAQDDEETFNDSVSGNDVTGLVLPLRLGWRGLTLDPGKSLGRW